MMENEKKESILRKVKKLLALSKSPNEYEAALAAARAHELLLKYNLTLEEAGHAEEDVVFRISAGCSYKRPPAWLVELFVVVCQNFYCSPQRGGSGELLILGGKTDVEVAKFTFGYLSEEVKRLIKIFSKRYLPSRKYINDYALGACFSIKRTLDEMSRMNEARAEATGSAIVPLLSAKKDAINKYLENDPDYDPNPKKRTGADISSKAAFRAGFEDGKAVKVARGGLTA